MLKPTLPEKGTSCNLYPEGPSDGRALRTGLYSAAPAGKERDDKQDQEDEKQNFGDAGGRAGDPPEAEYRGDDRDDQKSQCPLQHAYLLLKLGRRT